MPHVFGTALWREFVGHTTCTSRFAVKHSLKFSATALANGGGNAFPICLYAAVLPPLNCHSSGKPCSRATILTVNRGIAQKDGPGASFAMPSPSTPNAAHAVLARVGPRSGPPCLWEPPTRVGAIWFADFFQALAPFHPFAAIKS